MIKFRNVCFGILICLFVSFISVKATLVQMKPKIEYIKIPIPPKIPGKINDDSVMNHIKKLKIKYPKIVLAQVKLESANYKSSLFKRNNNLLGFTLANLRPTTAKYGGKYAKYNNYIECITDYALFQASFIKNIRSENEYYTYLHKHYAVDENYVKKLKFIVDTL